MELTKLLQIIIEKITVNKSWKMCITVPIFKKQKRKIQKTHVDE